MTEIELRSEIGGVNKIAYAQELANASLLPDAYKKNPSNVLWAVEYGETLGLTPMAAIQGIDVIKGKPTASAKLIASLVRQAGHRVRIWSEQDAKGNPVGIATIHREDDPDFEYRSEWTIERARTAGLLVKDTWKQYPVQMLKNRATTEAARDACAEVLFGLAYTPEEMGAEVDEDGQRVVGGQVVNHRPTSITEAAGVTAVAEPIEEPEGDLITPDQLKRLAGLMRFRGMGSDDGKRLCSEVAGRTVQSSRSLTTEEADRVIAALSEQESAVDAEVVEDPPATELPVEDEPDDPWAARSAPQDPS